MERHKFIREFRKAQPELDMEYADSVASGCLDRCHDRFPDYPRGHMNMVSSMEECAEFTEALSQRMRGRTDDNWGILEEMADVILSFMCVAQIYHISHEDIIKALNIKLDRESARIEDHLAGIGEQEG
jgi:NTP pyrophosphatase (non-canonical NTP hydrolase)